MYQGWVDASSIKESRKQDIWKVDYSAHPLLDPDFHRNGSRQLNLTRQTFRRIIRSDEAYYQEISRFFNSQNGDGSTPDPTEMLWRATGYLREADVYLDTTVALLPAESRETVAPLPLIRECNDVRDLMGISIHGETRRVRYEARRKLSMGLLLLQIDQSRLVQDAPAHKVRFEEMLNEGLWKHTKQIHDLSVGYRIGDEGTDIKYTTRPGPDDMRWDFRSTFIEKNLGDRTVGLDVLYYNCRFKLSVAPVSFEIVDGAHRVIEEIRWRGMKQATSGSIMSKMIRKGINNPDEIGDIIGAMFIVNDEAALDDLLVLIDTCLGTPFGWRNVTDTLGRSPGGSSLNDFSSKEFKVFKGDLDVLTNEEGGPSYRFPVEIQIYTLESFLRTVCGSHEASHLALKLRQFMFGLVPIIFPKKIYGTEWLTGEQAGQAGKSTG